MHTPTKPEPARRRRSLVLGLLALATLAGSALMVSGPATAAPAPPAGDCQVIDFRTATVDPLVSPDPSATTHRLTVTGVLSGPANVSLVPLTYVRQPEHWEIEVMACPAPDTKPPSLAGSPVVPPFRVFRATLDFHGTLGSCGIEVVGAETRQRFDLAGPPACETFGDHA